jgi:hypothetical protein
MLIDLQRESIDFFHTFLILALKLNFYWARNSDGCTNQVCAGANLQSNTDMTQSIREQMHGIVDLRQDLINNEVLRRVGENYVFQQDYSFSSPSTAAAIILGHSANGRTE